MAATTTANEAIKDRLDDWLQFHPANAKLLVPAWVLDPGDIVTVENEGVEYKLPIYNLDVEWRGESTGQISSTGKEKRPPLSELKRRSYARQKQTEEQQAQIDDVIYKTDFTKDDYGIGLLASAVGVKIDPVTGLPARDPVTNKFVFDSENGAALTSQINVRADGISAVATQAQQGVGTLTGRVDVMAGQIGLVVTGEGENAEVNTASIILAINGGTGHSSARIEATSIILDGNVTLNGALNITNGELVSNYPISTTDYLKGSSLTLSGTSAVNVTPEDLGGMVIKADVDTSTNTLKLWVLGDDPDGSPSINFSKAVAPTIGGSWSGSGTYNITSSPSAASGSKLTITPSVRLNGNGGATFTAEMLNDKSSPTVEKSVTGYLYQSGSSVGVYKTYSGGTYSDIIASISVSGVVPPSSHIQVESYGHYSPTYSQGGTQITSWVNVIKQAVSNNGYFYFDAWLSDNTSDKKRYYIKFS